MKRPAEWPDPPASFGVSRYSTQQITPEDERAVLDALRSPFLTQGHAVERFEDALAAYTGAKHAVAVSSGTAALHLAYLAARARSVVTSPLSFVATANAALLAGATVGFWDVDPATGNMDPDSAIRALEWGDIVVPVHFAGRVAKLDELGGGLMIEDACHALGAMDFDGCSKVGSCAHSLATVFSFHPVKPITTAEGGAITCNDLGYAKELQLLRSHGRDEHGLMRVLGLNYRMSELQAALGLSQLRRCDAMQERRRMLANEYANRLPGLSGRIESPTYALSWFAASDQGRMAHHLFPVRIKIGRRDEVKAKLHARGIGVQVHYSPIIPLQPYYRARFGHVARFDNAEAWAAEELSLPLHAGMDEKDVAFVCDALAEALR